METFLVSLDFPLWKLLLASSFRLDETFAPASKIYDSTFVTTGKITLKEHFSFDKESHKFIAAAEIFILF